jgi:hypothetical protein
MTNQTTYELARRRRVPYLRFAMDFDIDTTQILILYVFKVGYSLILFAGVCQKKFNHSAWAFAEIYICFAYQVRNRTS